MRVQITEMKEIKHCIKIFLKKIISFTIVTFSKVRSKMALYHIHRV